MPIPQDYPECLKHLLHRKIWTTTLGEVEKYLQTATDSIFIKPASDIKAFNGLIEPQDQMLWYVLEQFPRNLEVCCSELVEFVSEYRVYCINGEIKGISQYLGPKDAPPVDQKVIEDAVKTLFSSPEGQDLAGCSLDFAVMKKKDNDTEIFVTTLIEVKDGFALGYYEGVSPKDYTDLLIARWA